MKQPHTLPNPVGTILRAPSSEEAASVAPYAQAIWRRRFLIVILAAVGGGAALALAILRAPRYEASVTLVVTESKVADQQGPAVPVANFVSLLANHAVATEVIRQFGLDKPPYELGPTTFLRDVAEIERVPQTGLLLVRVRLQDPSLAARVANHVAEKGLELVQRMTQNEALHARDAIRAQLKESLDRLNEAEAKLETARKEGQVDLLKSDVETLLKQRETLAEISVQIEADRAWLAKAEQELSTRARIDVLNRTADDDTVLREVGKAAGQDLRDLQLKVEQVNSMYDDLDGQVARTRASLTAMEKQRAQLVNVSKVNAARLPRLAELYAREAEIARLETERELARRVYVDVAVRYEQARTQVASRSAQVQIVDPALPPEGAMPRNRGRNFLFGVLGGLFVGFAIVLAGQVARQASTLAPVR